MKQCCPLCGGEVRNDHPLAEVTHVECAVKDIQAHFKKIGFVVPPKGPHVKKGGQK